MRKILAFVACSMMVFSLGFTSLPSSFNLLVGWLGPVFGTSIHVLLSMIFILFGDPVFYPTLIAMWVGTGLLCGLIVRRRLGTASSAVLIFSAMFFVMAVAALRVIEIATEIGFSELFSVLPPLPPGATLGTILSAPIVGEIYGFLQGSQAPLTGDFAPLMWIVASNSVKNLALVVLSCLAGCELGKRVEPLLSQKISKRRRLRDEVEGGGGRVGAPKLSGGSLKSSRVALLLLLSILVGSMIFSPSGTLDEPYYAEGILGFVDTDGTAYLISAFLDSDMFSNHIDLSASQFENAVLSILVSHEARAATLSGVLPSLQGGMPMSDSQPFLGDMGRFYEALPETIFLIVYIEEDADLARSKADMAASSFSEIFDAPLSYLASIPQEIEIGGSMYNAVFLIYYSDAPLIEVGHHIMDLLPTHRDGLVDLMDSSYGKGVFNPHETGISADGTVMTVGFFSPGVILNLLGATDSELPEFFKMLLPSSTAPVPMLGLFSYWANRYHSSSFDHTFSIAELLDHTDPIRFSPEATVSVLLTVAPNAKIEDGAVTTQPNVAKVVTSVDLASPESKPVLDVIQNMEESVTLSLISVESGSPISPEDLTVNFVEVLPLNLRVEKIIEVDEFDIDRRLEVTVKVINDDDADAAENVTLDDSVMLQYYGSSVEVVEGAIARSWSRIAAGSSETHTYSITFKREGVYTLPSAAVTYNYMDKTYDAESDYVYVNVRPPPLPSLLISGIPSSWGVLTRTIDRVQGLKGSGSTILASITAAVLGVLSSFEYRNLRRWIVKRK